MAAHPEEVTPEMIRARMADTREALAANLDRLRDKASPRNILRHQLSGAKGRLSRAEHKALSPFHRTADHADPEPGPERAGGPLRSVGSTVRRTVATRPVLAAGLAAGLGVALALLLPTRRH